MNNFKKYKSEFNNYTVFIEEDVPDFGWMLYIYQNDICIFDSNQDSLKICKEEAFEEFGIPMDSWVEITE